jgi:hypothetical protein
MIVMREIQLRLAAKAWLEQASRRPPSLALLKGSLSRDRFVIR